MLAVSRRKPLNRREMRDKLRTGPTSLTQVIRSPQEEKEERDSSDEEIFLRSSVRPGIETFFPSPHLLFTLDGNSLRLPGREVKAKSQAANLARKAVLEVETVPKSAPRYSADMSRSI